MKKSLLFIVALLFAGQITFAQAVQDNAVIPVSVTLNSILRLNVVSGGNIEFVVNTMGDYTLGIANATRYTTTFTVASSVDFDVTLTAEDADLISTDEAVGNVMLLQNIGYKIEDVGTGTPGDGGTGLGGNWILIGYTDATYAGSAMMLLQNSAQKIIESQANAGAGDVTKNKFEIDWELATPAVLAAPAAPNGSVGPYDPAPLGNLLYQSIAAGRYTTNVFLQLVSQ